MGKKARVRATLLVYHSGFYGKNGLGLGVTCNFRRLMGGISVFIVNRVLPIPPKLPNSTDFWQFSA